MPTDAQQASSLGETLFWKTIPAHEDSGTVPFANAEEHPSGQGFIFYREQQTACLAGVTSGQGFYIARLPSDNSEIIRFSAPCYLKQINFALGLTYGRQSSLSFTSWPSKEVQLQLARYGRVSRAALAGGNGSGDMMATFGATKVSGRLLGFRMSGGSLRVDKARNAALYGTSLSVADLLEGKVSPPPEMLPLYTFMDILMTNQATANTGRTSACQMLDDLPQVLLDVLSYTPLLDDACGLKEDAEFCQETGQNNTSARATQYRPGIQRHSATLRMLGSVAYPRSREACLAHLSRVGMNPARYASLGADE